MKPLWKMIVAVAFALPGSASLAFAQSSGDIELGRLLKRIDVLQKQKNTAAVIATYRQVIQLSTRLHGANNDLTGSLRGALGQVYRERGDYPQAEVELAGALAAFEAINDRSLIAEGINNLAALYWDMGQYQKSLGLHQRSLALFRKTLGDDAPQVAVSRANLAGVLESLGENERAEALFLQAIKVMRRHAQTHGDELSSAFSNLAGLYTRRGDLAQAEALLMECLELRIKRHGPQHPEIARTLNNLGAVYSAMGQYEKAEAMHLRGRKIFVAAGGPDSLDVARNLMNLATIDFERKRYDQAEANVLAALAIREQRLGREHTDVALCLHNLGGTYTNTKQFDKARAVLERSLAIREAAVGAEQPLVADSHMALGVLDMAAGNYDEADKRFQRALAIRTKRLPSQHVDLTSTYSALGHLYGATERWPDAATSFETARRGSRKYIDQVLPAMAETEQLSFLRAIDQPGYYAALTLALKQPKSTSIAELSAGWVINGKGLAQTTLAQRALLTRDSARTATGDLARELVDVRKRLATLSLSAGSGPQGDEIKAQLEQLARREAQLAQQLARLSGRGAGTVDWVELPTLRSSLPADSVLIEIVRVGVADYRKPGSARTPESHRYLAWIIPAAGASDVKVVDLGDADQLDEVVRAARTVLQAAPSEIKELGEPEAEAELRRALAPLGARVLTPLVEQAGAAKQIYLSPDALLWLLPWNALPVGKEQYAIEKYDVRLVLSGRDLIGSEAKFTTGPAIMIADPNYDLQPDAARAATEAVLRVKIPAAPRLGRQAVGASKLGAVARLPGAKTEALAVRPKLESYTGASPILYSDEWALEAVVKKVQQPRVLTISTHGFFHDVASEASETKSGESKPTLAAGNPLLRCGLMLAGCNHPAPNIVGEDGILTGLEIVGADLRGTELVVLSACETGLGEVRSGEGVAGLRQAFQLAGAKAVVSTLWEIPDRETAQLMTAFFDHLAKTGDKTASLRAAQLQQIEARKERSGGAHPFFWAAFTLTGV